MGTFRDDLHELCKREIQNAIGSEDAAANMTTELVSQLSSTIALVTCGNGLAWRPAVQHIVKSLPQQVFEKAKAVRDGYAEMMKEAGKPPAARPAPSPAKGGN